MILIVKMLTLLCLLAVVSSSMASPVPSPDFKSAVMEQVRKLPGLMRSVIPMPENVAVTINVDNRKGGVAPDASQRASERKDAYPYPASENGHQEFLHNNSSTSTDIPNHHVLAMFLISIGVFVAGTIFVLTLWFCFRRRKKLVTTIIGATNNDSDSAVSRQYNNQRTEELLPKKPNVQKLIAEFNRK